MFESETQRMRRWSGKGETLWESQNDPSRGNRKSKIIWDRLGILESLLEDGVEQPECREQERGRRGAQGCSPKGSDGQVHTQRVLVYVGSLAQQVQGSGNKWSGVEGGATRADGGWERGRGDASGVSLVGWITMSQWGWEDGSQWGWVDNDVPVGLGGQFPSGVGWITMSQWGWRIVVVGMVVVV